MQMAQHQAAEANDWAATQAHGFCGVSAEERAELLHISDALCPPGPWPGPAGYTGHPVLLRSDIYHLGDRDELLDERFEAQKAAARQTALDCLRAGLAQMPMGAGGAVPADDAAILSAFEDRIDAARYPCAAILQALRGDLSALWLWAEEAFSQAANGAADQVRRGGVL